MSTANRLSLFWFIYFAGFGVYFPYFSLYLRENAALSGSEVGLVLAVPPLIGVLLQPAWGQLADRSGERARVLVVATFGAALGFAVLGVADGFAQLAAATALLAVFAAPAVPLASSVTLALTESGGAHAFGRVRMWGTVGFLLLVVAFPAILDGWHRGRGVIDVAGGASEPGLGLMFPTIAILMLLAALVGATLPRTGTIAARARRHEWRRLLRHPPMRSLAIYCLLAHVFLQGPMALFPVFVTARGGTIETVGWMWVVMLTIEIPLVAYAGAWVHRLGAHGLLRVGVLVGGLRWLVCATSDDPWILFAVQSVHAVTVLGLMLGAPLYLEQIVPARLRSTGQAVLAVVGAGVGGMVSTTASGWFLEHLGVDGPYVIGGAGAVLLGLAGRKLLPPPVKLRLPEDEPEPVRASPA